VPTVSTIIPVYNGAAFLRQAVDSVLAQRQVSGELIVIDDGSTDDTWRVLESYSDALRKERQANGGVGKARNLGARLASGEWLAFLDADDAWLPDKLAKQLEMAGPEVGLVYTDRRNIGACSHVTELQSAGVQQFEGDIFEPLLRDNFITVSSVLMSRDWFERLGGFHTGINGCEDWDLWLRYAAAGGQVRLCRELLTLYRWHATSMSTNQEGMCASRLEVLRRALASPRGRRVSPRLARQARAGVWQCSASQAAPARRWQALGWYLRSAAYWPWNVDVYKGMVKCCLGRA
jgi:glycosyltransferase involved in cell wall biosynthesis